MRWKSTAATMMLAGLLAGCGGGGEQTPAASPNPGVIQATAAPTTTAATSSAAPTGDPYEVYLANVPKGEPTLSRSDASTRALLGCGRTWPPGTTDAVLAEAYAAYCK